MNPSNYYEGNILLYNRLLKRINIKRNLVTISKLLVFLLIIGEIYLFVSEISFPYLWIGLFLVALFIILTFVDTKIVIRKQEIEELIILNQTETEYLQGNLSHLPGGTEFEDITHAYSGDLDLFGEESLFQHLNRTVTANGTRQLASWLLFPCKKAETILDRQQTAKELAALPDWCQQFRALGKLHPTQASGENTIAAWQQEPHFFRNPRIPSILVYFSNAVTIASWLLAVTNILPYTIATLFSLIQLLIIALFLKKINRQHQRLGCFIKSMGNYFYLVRLLNIQSFRSPGMSAIKNILFNKENNSQRAFATLNHILNGFDQRGNVLLAFILNGLYMKDLHTAISLDKWKSLHCKNITPWIEAVSQTDACVSMAIYRFNHPGYTEPQISTSALLDARAAGHPLMKGNLNVRNDFKIESLHNLYIVTGANMAGKSTFLRTIGINLVLAQSGNVVCSESLAFQPMTIFTSMRTTDNLAKGTSYFHAELLRLKALVNTATNEERLFIILDEMLKGTNSVDKLNGSQAFLRKLLTLPISGLVATHDLALGELATGYPQNFFNVCFEITHTNDDITYDYKLHPGLSQNMNASILLQQMGLI